MNTAEEFFTQKNGGKTPDQFVQDQEFVGALWCVEMMQEHTAQTLDKLKGKVEELDKGGVWKSDVLKLIEEVSNE